MRKRHLTDEQVLAIPDLIAAGKTWQQIADAYKISRTGICYILRGKTYRDLQDRLQPKLAAIRQSGEARSRAVVKRTKGKKVCTKCDRLLPENADHFPRYTRKGKKTLAARCHDCKRRQNRTRYIETKLRVLRHYSGGTPRCACCGEDRYEFLTFDHINGGGRQHRDELKRGPGGVCSIHTWLEKEGFPPGFQVLCLNCNGAHGFFGYCPHEGRPEDAWVAEVLKKGNR